MVALLRLYSFVKMSFSACCYITPTQTNLNEESNYLGRGHEEGKKSIEFRN